RFGFPDDALDILHLGDVDLPGTLTLEEGIHGRGERVDLWLIDKPIAGSSYEEIDVPTNVVIKNGDVAARLVCNRNLVLVFDELAQDAAHRDDVVIRMGREANDALVRRQLGFTSDLRSEDVEYFSVHLSGSTKLCN